MPTDTSYRACVYLDACFSRSRSLSPGERRLFPRHGTKKGNGCENARFSGEKHSWIEPPEFLTGSPLSATVIYNVSVSYI